MEDSHSAAHLAKKVTVLDPIFWLRAAWSVVQESAVRQCFKKCGFGLNHDATEDQPAPVIADNDMGPILGDVTLEDYANMEDDAKTTKPAEANWDANLRDFLTDAAPSACSDDEADATTEECDVIRSLRTFSWEASSMLATSFGYRNF